MARRISLLMAELGAATLIALVAGLALALLRSEFWWFPALAFGALALEGLVWRIAEDVNEKSKR